MIERSVFDKSFFSTVEQWLSENGEIYVVIRYSYRAGLRDYLLLHSLSKFRETLNSLPVKTDVIVFRQRQLPVRGIANENLLLQALKEIPDGIGWTMEEYDADNQTIDCCLWGGTKRKELIESFEKFKGFSVAVGKTPAWWESDHEDMQSALVPTADGSLIRGVY